MKIKQAKILLEKINRLFASMTMDEHVSEIEKELMRNYVKSLYEEFLPENGVKANSIIEPPKKAAPAPKVQVVTPKPKVVTPPPPKVEVVTPPPPAPKPEPVVAEVPKVVVVEKVTPPPAPKPKPTPIPVVKSTPPPAPKPKRSKISEEMEDLFEFKVAKELSERLSDAPLKDLRKAMGINERILTTNELFDGNGDALKDALAALNNLNNFDEAKNYLANIGEIYDWTAKKKRKKAKIFVKLIRSLTPDS